MPTSIDSFGMPKWLKYKEKQPFVTDKKAKYYRFDLNERGWRDGFLQPGYNPNHNSTKVERININKEGIRLKPY